MKSKITAKCAAVLMSALIGASSCAIPTFAATTANDNCINPSTISSIFNNNQQDSSSVLTRRPENIQPMSLNYLMSHLDELVTGFHDKGVFYQAKNVDLKSDIHILDPRIVYATMDDSKVDVNKCGIYPVSYTICYKPLVNDTYNKNDTPPYSLSTRDGITYTLSDIASRLSGDEYITVKFQSAVIVSTKTYWDAVLQNPDEYFKHHQINPNTYIYQDNMKRYDHGLPLPSGPYYPNLTGTFKVKTASITQDFITDVGGFGYFCAKCGKTFTPFEWGNHFEEAVSQHEFQQCHSNWVTMDTVTHHYHVGDTINFSIFSTD